jgi:hypothetical protein
LFQQKEKGCKDCAAGIAGLSKLLLHRLSRWSVWMMSKGLHFSKGRIRYAAKSIPPGIHFLILFAAAKRVANGRKKPT